MKEQAEVQTQEARQPTGCSVRGQGSEGMTLCACLSELCGRIGVNLPTTPIPLFLGVRVSI